MRLRIRADEWVIKASVERQMTSERMAVLNDAGRDVSEQMLQALREIERESR